jgi:hypothetical protein
MPGHIYLADLKDKYLPLRKKLYGASMDEWIKQRNKILAPETIKIFNTQSLKDCGLDKILPALRPF